MEPAVFHLAEVAVPGLHLWPVGVLSKVFAGIAKLGRFFETTEEMHRHRLYHVRGLFPFEFVFTPKSVNILLKSSGAGC